MKRLILSVTVCVAAIVAIASISASDHLDSPYMDDHPMRDIGDLFLWTGQAGPVFLINMDPLTAPDDPGRLVLDDSTLYEFKIDTDSDLLADIAYKLAVEGSGDYQSLTLYRATGQEAVDNLPQGTVVATGNSTPFAATAPTIITGTNGEKLFVGPRQDPFFFNFKGVESPVALDLRFALSGDGLPSDGTSADTFGPTNIVAIVLEIPALSGTTFRAWSTTSVNGKQEDRVGRSSVTAIFLPNTPTGRNSDLYPYGHLKQPYNTTQPKDDVANYRDVFMYRLAQVQVDENQNASIADFFLPDVLEYDADAPQEYPNGRNLKEDAVFWTINYINPFMAETDSTLTLPEESTQPLTETFPYAAPPIRPCPAPGWFRSLFMTETQKATPTFC